jgi:hypothetical protein
MIGCGKIRLMNYLTKVKVKDIQQIQEPVEGWKN